MLLLFIYVTSLLLYMTLSLIDIVLLSFGVKHLHFLYYLHIYCIDIIYRIC